MRNSRIFLYLSVTLMIILTSCKDNSPGSDPGNNINLPDNLAITAPAASQIYWDDQAVSCEHNAASFSSNTQWLVDGEAANCTAGKLDTEFSSGVHTVTARISEDGQSVEASVSITVKQSFSVSLDNPEDGTRYFVGDEVSCSATVEPALYEDSLQILLGETACTSGSGELTQSGEMAVVAEVTVDGRTETDEVTVHALPTVSGTIHPLTDRGVVEASGFTVTLTADGERFNTTTDAEGRFHFADAPLDIYERQSITMEVAETGDFYGAKAVLPETRFDEEDLISRPAPAGYNLRKITEADELGFVLAPRRWQIRDGELAGVSTNLKLHKAFTRAISGDNGSSFFKLNNNSGEYKYNSIFSEEIPIPTAFNRAESAVAITASDSTDFWQQTDEVTEPYVGRGNLFAPATIAAVPTIGDGIRVQFLEYGERSSASSGITGNDGYIIGGWMRLAIHNLGSYVQTHEQIHNLGFSHTDAWDGLMTYESYNGPGGFLLQLSVNDITHIQVYIDTFDLQYAEGVSFGVLEWMLALDIPNMPETTSSRPKTAEHATHTGSFVYETIECDIH